MVYSAHQSAEDFMLWYPLLLSLAAGRAPSPTVAVRLTEWKVELSRGSVAPGPVSFVVTNAGSIPHA
ncbi:MAG TPA: hypothetical protein VI160_04755, partial [Gemmatimonadales bacterium]